MSAAREEICSRIRRANLRVSIGRAEDFEAIRRQYQQVGHLDAEQKLALFEDRLHDYGAIVYRCVYAQIAKTVAQAMAARGAKSLLISAEVPMEWLPTEFEFKSANTLSYEELDSSEGTLTDCAAAVAITGTIILEHRPGRVRRVVTLIPDYHLCVLFSRQLFETVPEAIRQLSPSSRLPITMISGPSATADIEMTRVKGVHGPRSLDVILVEE